MERAAFLIEASNERISCLLNPEHVVVQRNAGIRPRQSLSGQLTGRYRSDDPLLYTGGGRTEITMNLLFDVSLLGSSISAEDVRMLTRPLWNLSENHFRRVAAPHYIQPPVVRFIWGKAWNIAGVIAAVSERLEYFNERGIPQRSWIRLMMLRTEEESLSTQGFAQSEIAPRELVIPSRSSNDVLVHEVTGAGESAERLDEIAQRYYGDASMWRMIASNNGISDPMALVAGTLLRIPPIEGAS
jgi:hypothetical protein